MYVVHWLEHLPGMQETPTLVLSDYLLPPWHTQSFTGIPFPISFKKSKKQIKPKEFCECF